jgi:hypothetical protein
MSQDHFLEMATNCRKKHNFQIDDFAWLGNWWTSTGVIPVCNSISQLIKRDNKSWTPKSVMEIRSGTVLKWISTGLLIFPKIEHKWGFLVPQQKTEHRGLGWEMVQDMQSKQSRQMHGIDHNGESGPESSLIFETGQDGGHFFEIGGPWLGI